jgi:hypothetical protein
MDQKKKGKLKGVRRENDLAFFSRRLAVAFTSCTMRHNRWARTSSARSSSARKVSPVVLNPAHMTPSRFFKTSGDGQLVNRSPACAFLFAMSRLCRCACSMVPFVCETSLQGGRTPRCAQLQHRARPVAHLRPTGRVGAQFSALRPDEALCSARLCRTDRYVGPAGRLVVCPGREGLCRLSCRA